MLSANPSGWVDPYVCLRVSHTTSLKLYGKLGGQYSKISVGLFCLELGFGSVITHNYYVLGGAFN